MTFGRLLLEIRRRAAALPDDGRRREAIERIAREILAEISVGEQADKVRRILAAFLGLGEGDTFDAALLEQMTPELVLQLIAAAFPGIRSQIAIDTRVAIFVYYLDNPVPYPLEPDPYRFPR